MRSIKLTLAVLFLLQFAITDVNGESSEPRIDPPAIEINAVKDHSEASATFYVTPRSGMENISFFVSDLRDTTGVAVEQPVLLANQFSFSPDDLADPQPDQRAQVRVTVTNVNHSGVWSGTLILQWTGQITGELTLPMTVRMKNVPTLVAEAPTGVVAKVVRGTRIEPRRVTLHETSHGSAAANLNAYARDLTSEDQSRILPSANIRPRIVTSLPNNQIPGGGRGDVVIDVSLENIRSGSYTGNLIVQGSNTQDLLIPITVQVKDPASGAWIVLALGVLLGVVLTWYRSTVMPKDQLRVASEEMQTYLQQNLLFKTYFFNRVNRELTLVENHLRSNNVPDAASAMKRAQDLRTVWLQNSDQLLPSIGIIRGLLEIIKTPEDGFSDLAVAKQLDDELSQLLTNKIPDYVNQPNELSDNITNNATGWKPITTKLRQLYTNVQALNLSLSNANGSGNTVEAETLAQLRATWNTVNNDLRTTQEIPNVATVTGWQEQINRLVTDFNTASAQGALAKQNYEHWKFQTTKMLPSIQGTPATEQHIKDAANRIERSIREATDRANQAHWSKASQIADNMWHAALATGFLMQSANARTNKTDPAWQQVLQAEQDLATLLQTIRYDQPNHDFDTQLKAKTAQLEEALKHVGTLRKINWDAPASATQPRSLGAKEISSSMELSDVPEVPQRDPTIVPVEPSWWERLWTPRHRLWLLNILTFIIGVGLLVMAGFKELYQDIATFGVEGIWDYFKLLVWGFGAEAGRAQIVGLVKDWGIMSPRQS